MPYTVTPTNLSEVLILEPQVFGDDRGFFFESFSQYDFQQATGLDVIFVQDNHSKSNKGVIRGLHYQIKHPQGKLVRVTLGTVFDVAVDLRRSSPNFGKWVGTELSAENKRQLWVPPGFAHGFLSTSEVVDFEYKCTDYYDANDEGCIHWNDPLLQIDWPSGINFIISSKDDAAESFQAQFG